MFPVRLTSFSFLSEAMPRVYKKKLGTRPYVNYSHEKLEECLEAIRAHQITQRQAEQRFGIPRSTIKHKLAGKHTKKVGRSRLFTDEEELSFKQHLIKMCDFGFPVDELDFRMAVKSYLDKKGITTTVFKNNLPGYEWTKSFLKRHQELSVRMSSNIKKVRAEVNEDEINTCMDNLSEAIKIFHHPESGITTKQTFVMIREVRK